MADPKSSAEEALQTSMGPILFKIAMEQQSIKEVFGLLKKIFKLFDKGTGTISTKDLLSLRSYGLLSEKGAKRLESYHTAQPGQWRFREFAAFFVIDFLKPVESKSDEKEPELEIDLPDEINKQIAPVAFRLDARADDSKRIFTLFLKLFELFEPKDGKLAVKEMNRLVEGNFLEEAQLKKLEEVDHAKTGYLTADSFLAFWIHHFVEELEDEEEKAHAALKSKLGPIIFKIMLEQQHIKELFDLLQQVFNVLDGKQKGLVEKKELEVLRGLGLISEGGVKRLQSWPTAKEGFVDLKEFIAFFSAEYVRKEFEVGDYSQGKEEDIPEKYLTTLAPIVFKLSARHLDLQRIFNLFKQFFEVFDSKKKGSISKEELVKLKDEEIIDQEEIDDLLTWDTARKGAIDFNEFLAFWVAHFVDETNILSKEKKKAPKEKEQDESSPEGVVALLKIHKENFKRTLELTRKLFTLLDKEKKGVAASDLSVLTSSGFLDDDAFKSIKDYKTSSPGMFTFPELLHAIALALT